VVSSEAAMLRPVRHQSHLTVLLQLCNLTKIQEKGMTRDDDGPAVIDAMLARIHAQLHGRGTLATCARRCAQVSKAVPTV
jgi:hypothetical protein